MRNNRRVLPHGNLARERSDTLRTLFIAVHVRTSRHFFKQHKCAVYGGEMSKHIMQVLAAPEVADALTAAETGGPLAVAGFADDKAQILPRFARNDVLCQPNSNDTTHCRPYQPPSLHNNNKLIDKILKIWDNTSRRY